MSESMYATLPKTLTQELHVRSKVKRVQKIKISEREPKYHFKILQVAEGDDPLAKHRKELVESKSPTELGQIHSFSEIPVPKMIESWLHSSDDKR